MEHINLIGVISNIVAWLITAILFVYFYRKREVNSKLWKALLVLLIGLFSFTINWQMFGKMISFPILPLGVWLVLLYCSWTNRKERWQVYRPFAWIGFSFNFILLIMTLISAPIQEAVYPSNDPRTYIADVDHAQIVNLHPSAQDQVLQIDLLQNGLNQWSDASLGGFEWYYEMDKNNSKEVVKEGFPYQLVGAKAMWGSGLQSIIYIEEDGKGLLITTPEKQYYFRLDQSLFKERKTS
ncbi:hypothetical protein [Tenuibacillus multivorans]|uniref:Uncharacterized protein n=1 Tax=Tenuibacillus multivorans TaxID=237069 RepID=A0A1H0A1K5_9BACI|nr:hypothetical protein [Tenuibacillus multivorans]GEL78360.1 hypothetical protein TMU01_25950 [Tenuibacillus multivorans]SDN27365.1 hypothetical protein SAMN05216498_1924 [Tenuibacillus multivorans]